MQQYFVQTPLIVGEKYLFTKEQAHHAKNVMKMHHDTVRLVYDGIGYFADAYNTDHGFVAKVLEEDPRVNELDVDVTLAIGMIRREKYELILQKAGELGVKHIVPFESSRTIVHMKKEKEDKLLTRWSTILQEASEQCKRNMIPTIESPVKWKELVKLQADCKLAPYENAFGESRFVHEALHGKSILIVIGPEGGFSEKEMEELQENGFESVTLGSRILRAETAAIYALSVVGEWSATKE